MTGRGGELSEKKFTAEQKVRFGVAKKCDIEGVIDSGAIWVCTPEEAAQLRASGHRVLHSQFVPAEEAGARVRDESKGGMVCLGQKGPGSVSCGPVFPDAGNIYTYMVLVVLAPKRWKLVITGAKMAFMQSDHRTRAGGRLLYASLPPGGVSGYPPGTDVELLTAAYGLVVRRETLRRHLLELH